MFHVGQLVVCVDDSPLTTGRVGSGETVQSLNLLKKGEVYTIRKIDPQWEWIDRDGGHYFAPGVWLEEVVRSDLRGLDEPMGAKRFRPVQKNKIEIFTKMLTPVREDA